MGFCSFSFSHKISLQRDWNGLMPVQTQLSSDKKKSQDKKLHDFFHPCHVFLMNLTAKCQKPTENLVQKAKKCWSQSLLHFEVQTWLHWPFSLLPHVTLFQVPASTWFSSPRKISERVQGPSSHHSKIKHNFKLVQKNPRFRINPHAIYPLHPSPNMQDSKLLVARRILLVATVDIIELD